MENACSLYTKRLERYSVIPNAKNLFGKQRHFALGIVGKQTFLGWNNKKTHPQLVRTKENGHIVYGYHAETHVLYKIPKNKRKHAKILVCRLRKGKGPIFTMSKPCLHCTETLLSEGVLIKNIWFTNIFGEWECLKKYY